MFFEGTQVYEQVWAKEHSGLNMHSQLVLVYPRQECWSVLLVGRECNSVANSQSEEEEPVSVYRKTTGLSVPSHGATSAVVKHTAILW